MSGQGAMIAHRIIEVGRRRWCLDCGAYQVHSGGRWRDIREMLGPWPAYQPMRCEELELNE